MKTQKISIVSKTDRVIKNNLISWIEYAKNFPDIWESGLNWYKEAQNFTQEISKKYNIDSYTVAGVISALSPNNKWERNKFDAENIIAAHVYGLDYNLINVCTYKNNKRKAIAILEEGKVIAAKSPKTHAFSMNVGLLSANHITADKWHLRACMSKSHYSPKNIYVESCTNVQYIRIEAITAEVAKEYGLKGYELQAIIWVSIKNVWEN